jgi:hypothetical protein
MISAGRFARALARACLAEEANGTYSKRLLSLSCRIKYLRFDTLSSFVCIMSTQAQTIDYARIFSSHLGKGWHPARQTLCEYSWIGS